MHFPNWCITENHHSHLIISSRWPKNLNLFSLRVCYNLSRKISLITLIEHVNSVINDEICEINLFFWCKSKLLDSECFFSSQTWSSSHNFFDVSWLWSVIPWCFHLWVHFSNVLHSIWTIIWWNWATLSNWMNMSHVVDWWWWVRMDTS